MKRMTVAVLTVVTVAVAAVLLTDATQHKPVDIENIDAAGEWVEIKIEEPQGVDFVDMGGWVLISLGPDGSDDVDQVFHFPGSCRVPTGADMTIWSGDRAADLSLNNSSCLFPPVDLYWDASGNSPNVWNNSGDTACLLDEDLDLVDQQKVAGGTSDCEMSYAEEEDSGGY